jgi:hypothetical protein
MQDTNYKAERSEKKKKDLSSVSMHSVKLHLDTTAIQNYLLTIAELHKRRKNSTDT